MVLLLTFNLCDSSAAWLHSAPLFTYGGRFYRSFSWEVILCSCLNPANIYRDFDVWYLESEAQNRYTDRLCAFTYRTSWSLLGWRRRVKRFLYNMHQTFWWCFRSLSSKLTLDYYRGCPGISNVAFPAFNGKVTSKFNQSSTVKLRKISTDDNLSISPIFILSGRWNVAYMKT